MLEGSRHKGRKLEQVRGIELERETSWSIKQGGCIDEVGFEQKLEGNNAGFQASRYLGAKHFR